MRRYGHLDVGDFSPILKLGCPSPAKDRTPYQREVVRLMGEFVRGIFAEAGSAVKSAAYDALENASAMAIDVELDHTYAGMRREDIVAGCRLARESAVRGSVARRAVPG